MGLWVILPNSNALKYSVSDPNCSLNWPGIRLTFGWIIKPFSRSINYHFPGRSIINNNHFTGHSSHRGCPWSVSRIASFAPPLGPLEGSRQDWPIVLIDQRFLDIRPWPGEILVWYGIDLGRVECVTTACGLRCADIFIILAFTSSVHHVVSDLICFIPHFHHDQRKRGEIDQVDGASRRAGCYKRPSACRGKHGDNLHQT